jgi:2-methylcitrate dehydratase PrpD
MRQLARNVLRTTFDRLPREAVETTREHLIHILGNVVAGSSAPGCDTLVKLVTRWGGAPESHVLVTGEAVPAPHAAMVHSAMAHAWEFDNNDDRIAYKSSTAAIPAALAVAERVGGVSGKELLTAACLGVDLGIRLGLATNPKPAHAQIPENGPFAAATAAGKLLGLDEEALLDALGIAYTGVSISGSSIVSPSLTKRLVAGLAARNGVFAAELASLGYPANRNILSGDAGFFRLFHGQDGDFETLTAGLGERFEIVGVGPKGYPSCRYTHASINATFNLIQQHDLRPEQVERVTVRISRRDLLSVGGGDDPDKLAARRAPQGIVEAQFSIPYTVARVLVSRKIFLDDYAPEALREPAVLDLASRVTPVVDPELDHWPLDVKPAIVEILLKDGRQLTERIDYPKGSPRNPVPPDEIRQNFRSLASFAVRPLPPSQISTALELLDNLEDLPDISPLVQALGGGGPRETR